MHRYLDPLLIFCCRVIDLRLNQTQDLLEYRLEYLHINFFPVALATVSVFN